MPPTHIVDMLLSGNKGSYSDNELLVRLMFQIIDADNITSCFYEFIFKMGFPNCSIHSLHHSCISLLVNCQIPMMDAQVYARHANFNTTANTYSHALNSSTQTSLDIIVKVLNLKGIGDSVAVEDNVASNGKQDIAKQIASFCGIDDIYAALVDVNGMF